MRLYVALGITVLWAVSYVVSVSLKDYTGISFTTPVMLIAGGWLLGNDLRKRSARDDDYRRRDGKDNGHEH